MNIIKGEDNVLNTYKPKLFSENENKDESYFLFLANGDPKHQFELINQTNMESKFIGLDMSGCGILSSAVFDGLSLNQNRPVEYVYLQQPNRMASY